MRQELLELARPRAGRSTPLDDHYAPESRAALHHLERSLFEDAARRASTPGDAVAFHSAGGERAEVELAGAAVLELLRDGRRPGDVAVVFREPGATRRWSSRSSAPTASRSRSTARCRFGHTGLGRGLLALLRCACCSAAAADDLLA